MNIKHLIVTILVLAAGFLGARGLFAEDPSLSIEKAGDSTINSSRFDALLNQLKNLQIDGAFFQSKTFSALLDNTVEVTGEPAGRPNPFLPIGVETGGGFPPSAPASSQSSSKSSSASGGDEEFVPGATP